MTLTFLTVLYVAGLTAWLLDRRWPWSDTPAFIGGAVVAGLGAGFFLSAWGA
jgi:hypothetical protein